MCELLELVSSELNALYASTESLIHGRSASRAHARGHYSDIMTEPDMQLFDLRVSVESIDGPSVCGLAVGDYFELVNSSELRIPNGKHFCVFALQSVLPLLPAKQRQLPANDWLERDSLVCCPDPEERVVMRIDRIGTAQLRSADLT